MKGGFLSYCFARPSYFSAKAIFFLPTKTITTWKTLQFLMIDSVFIPMLSFSFYNPFFLRLLSKFRGFLSLVDCMNICCVLLIAPSHYIINSSTLQRLIWQNLYQSWQMDSFVFKFISKKNKQACGFLSSHWVIKNEQSSNQPSECSIWCQLKPHQQQFSARL